MEPRSHSGFPSPADDYLEAPLNLHQLLVKSEPATFFLRVRSSIMLPAIRPNDILVVDRSLAARNGDIVVAEEEGCLAVRRYIYQHGQGRLSTMPAATEMSVTVPAASGEQQRAIKVWGVVRSVVRELRPG
ncbi:MAG: hypothetical protein KDK39_02710 [Leptospiraceae bacterium]|nr:hypothetical protein [Leptospiraceae bacterium]